MKTFRGNAYPRTRRAFQWGKAARMVVSALAVSGAGLVAVVNWEDFRGKAYIPAPGDVPTIGFGTTEGVRMGDTITPPVALQRALKDVQKFEGAIKRCVHVPLSQDEYDAYTSLAYNIGEAAFCGSTLVKLLNMGSYAGACAQISRWDRGPQGPLPGLTRRRAAERALCERGAL